MSKLLLTFYGDDFTGSTDALEQLMLGGIRTMLFIEPPSRGQLKRFPGLQAIGIAGKTRSLAPDALERELAPALQKIKKLGARHIHYKICSTFDSSPQTGSIGRILEAAAKILPAPCIPLLVAAPALGRYTIFGNHFARYGIGSSGAIHRLDRHPSISQHPVTPMVEADLRAHLARQTKKRIALFDILKLDLPKAAARAELKKLLAEKPAVVLFDALNTGHLVRIGGWLDDLAIAKPPLFSVGSSGIETALAAQWSKRRGGRLHKPFAGSFSRSAGMPTPPAKQILVGSGSCSPVTAGQIARARKQGFAEVSLDAAALAGSKTRAKEIQNVTARVVKLLKTGRNVIIHTLKHGPNKIVASKLKSRTAEVLGTALGSALRATLAEWPVQRVAIAGGDTSSYAARALGIEALEMIASLSPGAPLCRAHAPGSPADGCEIVFKGGQVGAEDYFHAILKGTS